MSSELLGGELLSVEKSTKKTSNKSTTNSKNDSKEGSSLFDKILQNASQKNETTETKTKTEIKQNTQKNIPTSNKQNEPEVKQQPTSLLDKMVQNIKSNTQSETQNNLGQEKAKKRVTIDTPSQVKKPIGQEEVKEKKVKKENTLEKLAQSADKTVVNQKTDPKEEKQSTSLMDQLIQKNQPKSDEKVSHSVDIKNSKKVIVSGEETKIEEKTVTKKIDTKDNASLKQEINTKTVSVKNEKLKEETTTQQEEKEVKKTPSLMDKIIAEAKEVETTEPTNKTNTTISKENNIKEINVVPKITKEIESKKTDDKPISMLDKMVQNIETTKNQKSNTISSKEESTTKTVETTIKTTSETNKKDAKNLVESNLDQKQIIQANRYLQEQNKSKQIVKENAQKDAKEVLVETKAELKAEEKVQKAAKILELNPSKVQVEEVAKEDTQVLDQKKLDQFVFKKSVSLLNRVYLNESAESSKPKADESSEEVKVKKTEPAQVEQKIEIKNVELKVDRNALEVFTSRVIAAKQKVETFMSDMARQMYQNYKPPITAFRINLNPANLGAIAIMIKSNKSDNSLNISMNMNQTNTFEVLSENKSTLQNAIAKNFNEDANIDLDLSFNDNSNNEFEAAYMEEQKKLKDETIVAENPIDETLEEQNTKEYM